MNINRFILPLLILTLTACLSPKKQTTVKVVKAFTAPSLPAMITSPEQKAEFIANHYWDNFDFADTTLISRADITEQAFADFVNILPHIPHQFIEKGITVMMDKAMADSSMYAHFMGLTEKYLYDSNSPFRNEDIYIVVLRNIIANTKLDTIYKIRPQYQLELALKNRVGDKAIDFEYTTPNGSKAKLYGKTGDPLLLFFYRPDCQYCKDVKDYITSKKLNKRVEILLVNPDVDTHLDAIYDLRASPTLYLLDKDKAVLLKDATIEQIEQYLNEYEKYEQGRRI